MKPEMNQQSIETEQMLPFLRDMFADGKQVQLTVTGNSMYPLWRSHRDTVVLAPADNPDLFDVVLFLRDSGELVLHRIVKQTDAGYMIIGDNEFTAEGPIRPDQLLARMVGFYRDERYVSCEALWYRLYRSFWGRCRRSRKAISTIILLVVRQVKRIKRWGKA
ncbi:MAG: hypothetical protein E7402_05205 [Ruminococcaceae bacterium]|nr:hypothetical protein [Oscillospiraceae bacterium]